MGIVGARFFRDNLSSLISLLVLLPISLFINWRLALLLIVLCIVFALLTAVIVRKTERRLQSSVERRSLRFGRTRLGHAW